jgi:hypothetical protein
MEPVIYPYTKGGWGWKTKLTLSNSIHSLFLNVLTVSLGEQIFVIKFLKYSKVSTLN